MLISSAQLTLINFAAPTDLKLLGSGDLLTSKLCSSQVCFFISFLLTCIHDVKLAVSTFLPNGESTSIFSFRTPN